MVFYPINLIPNYENNSFYVFKCEYNEFYDLN